VTLELKAEPLGAIPTSAAGVTDDSAPPVIIPPQAASRASSRRGKGKGKSPK
jgi:hypothetical protein